jgi:hypothetical protein
VYLYDQGFSSLGHIQTGNIFVSFASGEAAGGASMVDANVCCRLGGYENTLLGYKPRLHRLITEAGKLARIDSIMFGHVIYEMACGCELGGVEPTSGEYAAIYDDGVRSVLRKIFTQDMVDERSIPEVSYI